MNLNSQNPYGSMNDPPQKPVSRAEKKDSISLSSSPIIRITWKPFLRFRQVSHRYNGCCFYRQAGYNQGNHSLYPAGYPIQTTVLGGVSCGEILVILLSGWSLNQLPSVVKHSTDDRTIPDINSFPAVGSRFFKFQALGRHNSPKLF